MRCHSCSDRPPISASERLRPCDALLGDCSGECRTFPAVRMTPGKRRSRRKPQSGAARSPRRSRASARQSRVADVLPLRFPACAIGRPSASTWTRGNRSEPRVVVRPEGSTSARARRRCDPDGTRAHATPATTRARCASGRDGRSKTAKPIARRRSRASVPCAAPAMVCSWGSAALAIGRPAASNGMRPEPWRAVPDTNRGYQQRKRWTSSEERPILGSLTSNGDGNLKLATVLVVGSRRNHYRMRQARACRSRAICKGAH